MEKPKDLGYLVAIDQIGRLRKALECVDALPPGSRGAYGKFVLAKQIAKAALRGEDQ